MGASGWITVYSDSMPKELLSRADKAYMFSWSELTLGGVKYYILYGDTERDYCQVDRKTEQEIGEELDKYEVTSVDVWS